MAIQLARAMDVYGGYVYFFLWSSEENDTESLASNRSVCLPPKDGDLLCLQSLLGHHNLCALYSGNCEAKNGFTFSTLDHFFCRKPTLVLFFIAFVLSTSTIADISFGNEFKSFDVRDQLLYNTLSFVRRKLRLEGKDSIEDGTYSDQ